MCSHELQPLQWRPPSTWQKSGQFPEPQKAEKEFLVPMLPLSLVCRCSAPSARLESKDIFESNLVRGRSFRRHQLDQIFGIRTDVRKTVQERRNFREGISSRSGHAFSRYVDLWHREVWVTVQKLSKTASYTTFACTCLAGIFFCSSIHPCVTFHGSLALLLLVWLPLLWVPWRRCKSPPRGLRTQVDQILAVLQGFGVRTGPLRSRRSEKLESGPVLSGFHVCFVFVPIFSVFLYVRCVTVSHTKNLTSCLKGPVGHPDSKNLIKLVSSENGKNETIEQNAWYKCQK